MRIFAAIISGVLFFDASAQECRNGCTLEEVNFSDEMESFPHRSRYVVVLGAAGSAVPKTMPVPVLPPPAFLQVYTSIEVRSDEIYSLSDSEIDEVNRCILQKGRCAVPMRGRNLKVGDSVVYEFKWVNRSQGGDGQAFAVSFSAGLESKVVVTGFRGKYSAEGVKIRYLEDVITFESIGDGYLLLSEIPSWNVYSDAWVGEIDVDSVADISSEIFSDGLSAEDAIGSAREWIASNINYIYSPLSVAEMRTPESVSVLVDVRQGDCKGMVLLLQSLLASVGINSHPVYTKFNDDKKLYSFDPEIPNPGYFDHVVLYVEELDRYYDATLRVDQLDDEITKYLSFALHAGTGELVCFNASDCKGVPKYQLPR